MLKQITEKEALAAYTKGKDIKVLVPPTCIKESEWEDYEATLLSRLLEGTVYLADEEEKEEAAPAPVMAPESAAEPEEQPAPQRPGPATWPVSQNASQPATPPALQPVLHPAIDDDADGTWLVSTSMGSVFSKYVFICSKCGYRKESMFSFTPMTNCPECEKRKAGIV